MGATDEQLDFPIVYASGLSGFAKLEETDESNDMRPLFDTILKHTPAPSGSADETLQLQISQLDYDNYTGRLGIGRILNGRIKPGQSRCCYEPRSSKSPKAASTSFWVSKVWNAYRLKKPKPATS